MKSSADKGAREEGEQMEYDAWFDTDENRTLLAICTRKLISNIGIAGVIWGLINIAIGVVAIQQSLISVGVLMLGVMMLGTGAQALKTPSLGVLLIETVVTVLLLLWNLGMTVLNLLAGGVFQPWVVELPLVVAPLVVAIVFANYYRKLGHLRELIPSVEAETIKHTKQIRRALLKKRLKVEPSVVETRDGKCRAQLMDDRAFFIQSDLMRAFVASRADILKAVAKLEARRLKMLFNHPLGRLKYQFDKKDSQKWKNWLAIEADQTALSNLKCNARENWHW
jgi:hypothetical protein